MGRTKKTFSCLVLICFLSCFLFGCPSPGDESKQAEQHVSLAISMAEVEVPKIYPNAMIKTNTFYGISGAQTGPDHLMTDWVKGEYQDGGEEEIMVNVLTKDIFVTSEWHKISSYGLKSVKGLYGLDDTNMDGSVHGYIEKPYCIDDPDKYGNLKMWNMLPLGTVVNDDYAEDLLKDEKYSFLYELEVNEDVDMKIFVETDYSSLGRNVHIQVNQYDNEFFKHRDTPYHNADSDTDKPIATFDSENN
jgi:hypothetical protein